MAHSMESGKRASLDEGDLSLERSPEHQAGSSGAQIGLGKVAVLEGIARSGSIYAAGRAMRMSYRRTWELADHLDRGLGTLVVATAAGGTGGGGAVLTRAGKTVIERYRAIEMDSALAARKHLQALHRAVTANDA
jgi:molybdate transport system regulatory protein